MERCAMGLRLASFPASGFLFAAAFLAASSATHAQTSPPAPELKQNPIALLRAFEPAADQEYQLGRGDEISIEVIGRPELGSKHVIGPDGRITLSIAGPILLADKTREQAAAEIETALGKYYSNVSVSVGVDHYTSNHITLMGDVEHPGLMAFDDTPTLLEVISRGGYPPQLASGTIGTPGTAGKATGSVTVPEECIIYRIDPQGNQTVVTVQLR